MNTSQELAISAAQLISDLGKGGGYVGLCALLSLFALAQRWRARQARPLFTPQLTAQEQLTWRLWAYWVLGTLINQALKFTIAQPRPWWIDPASPPLSASPSDGFGMPSGHAQGAVGLCLLAYSLWAWRKETQAQERAPSVIFNGAIVWPLITLCALWLPLTMWARVTLHAHSVEQVFAGASVGLLWSVTLVRAQHKSASQPLQGVWALALIAALCLITLGLHLYAPPEVPEAWREVIERASGEPAHMAPKLKVMLALAVASLGLLWALARDARAR